MGWYCGTPEQQRLQQRVDEMVVWCRNVRGAVNAGRMLGVDDIDALGWEAIFDRLEKDGVFTFRMVPKERIAEVEAVLAERDFRIDWWNVFKGSSETVLKHTADEGMRRLPEDYTIIRKEELTKRVVQQMQACMERNGVRPYSGRMIAGMTEPMVSLAVRSPSGKIVATACGHMPYNSMSRHSRTAWGGLVAVDPGHRGMRLGVAINAEMVRRCVERLGARSVQEFVNADNETSRRMVERCGLSLDPTCMSGLATRGNERFTR